MSHTTAFSLKTDPRVIEAKKLLLETLVERQGKIKGVRPPDPDLKEAYEHVLHTFEKQRGGKLWYPYVGSGVGKGPLVELLDGSVKYDFISGVGVHYWGHSNEKIVDACIDAAISDTVMQGNLQQNGDSLEIMILLTKLSGLDHCFLTTSGAMANENGIKLAFHKHTPANRLLAFKGCFAGRTWALSQVTDKPAYRSGLPTNIFIDYIPFFDATKPEESTEVAVKALKEHLNQFPKQYAAMIFELVQGEGGFYPGDKQFFVALMEVLKEHGIAIIIDEVQTFARTTELFAFQYFGLEEYVDIVTIGKVSHVCATLFRHTYIPKPGLLSQTFTSSTAAIHSAKVMIEGMILGNFFGKEGKIAHIQRYMHQKLENLHDKYPDKINGPFGVGTMTAFTPFDGSMEKVKAFTFDLFDAGVISFIAGSDPTRVRFLIPAGAVEDHHIDEVISIVENVLQR